jgi:glycosyltransferase involved in cell wall biosynthesis
MTDAPTALTISVIMPAYNAEAFLRQSLPPLAAMLRAEAIVELIVVDDTSTDGSRAVAGEFGAHVIPSGGRLGPGGARNIAAALARGDILWFVDSDVVVHAGGPERIRDAFADPGVWALFGSYDDTPAAPNFGSQYKNLVHHHVHQLARREASTFWAGCGAVRKQQYLDVGGFDSIRYKQPSIEDIELGYRLRDRGGRIVLDKSFLSTHLKYWTVPELVRVDIFRRALPWARLMLERGGVDNDLNVSWTERFRAGLAGLIMLSAAGAAFQLIPWWSPFVFWALAVVANRQLFSTFARHRGPLFAIAAISFHQVYYLYSTASFVWCWLEHKLKPKTKTSG